MGVGRDQTGTCLGTGPKISDFPACHATCCSPRPCVFTANSPSLEGLGVCGGWATAERARWRLCEHQGAGPKTVKGKNALAREPLYFLLGSGWAPALKAEACWGFRQAGRQGPVLTRARGWLVAHHHCLGSPPTAPCPAGAPPPCSGCLETSTLPSLSTPVLAPDLLLGHLPCARQ